MSRTFAFFLLACCLLWGCQSKDTQDQAEQSAPPTQADQSPPVIAAQPLDWPMFMYDLYFSGRSPEQNLKPPLELLWKFKTGGKIKASPVVAGGVVYVGSTDRTLYALDAKQWGVKWTFKAGDAIRYPAAVWNNRVYFSARDNRVYALNAETGEPIWQFQSETWMDSPPIVINGKVYIGAFTKKIHVLNAETGALESQPESRIHINGIEYGCVQGQLRPVIPRHQADVWKRHIPYSRSYPAIANGIVYIGARDNRVYALDVKSKAGVWTYQTKGFVDAAPAIADGVLYVASHDGYVYAFGNQASEAAETQPDKRPIGTIAHDQAPVYGEKDSASDITLRLNDDVELPIVNQVQGWYQVELPNGATGWMDGLDIGTFTGTDGVAFNTAICSSPRTVELVEGAEYPHWSRDGRFIAFLKRTDLSGRYWVASELWIMDWWTKRSRRLCKGQFYNPHLSWSLDGNFIAFEAYDKNDSYVWIFDRKAAQLTKLVQGDAPEWSPTANQIAFRRWEEGVDIIYRINGDKSGLTPIVRIPVKGRIGSFSHLDAPTWSPDGKKIAVGLDHQHYKSERSHIRIHGLDGSKLEDIPIASRQVKQITWSADSSSLAYVLLGHKQPDPVLDKRLHIVDLDSPTRPKILKHTAPSWSPQGNRLVYVERANTMGVQWKVWILDLQSNKRYPVARTTINLASVKWLPDGKHLCLWHTSSYLRDGAYKPAKTKGWIVELAELEG
jgi:Tol biopolymer transport system component